MLAGHIPYDLEWSMFLLSCNVLLNRNQVYSSEDDNGSSTYSANRSSPCSTQSLLSDSGGFEIAIVFTKKKKKKKKKNVLNELEKKVRCSYLNLVEKSLTTSVADLFRYCSRRGLGEAWGRGG